MIDITLSVGFPSASAATHVPASFLSFPRFALVGGAGSFGVADLSSALFADVNASNSPPINSPRSIVVPPRVEWVAPFRANGKRTYLMSRTAPGEIDNGGRDSQIFPKCSWEHRFCAEPCR